MGCRGLGARVPGSSRRLSFLSAPITGLELELVEKSDPGGPASCARLLGKAVLSVPPVYSSMYVAAENPGLEGERPGTTHFFLGIEPARALEY